MAGSAKRGDRKAPAATGSNKDGKSNGGATAPGLDRIIQALIGDKLRVMYGELVEQPVPDKLAALLHQLSQRTPGR